MSQNSKDPNSEWDGGEIGVATATQAAPVAVADEPLPEGYKDLMAEHQRIYRAIPREKSRATRAKLTERHAIVKSRLAAMQNGPPAPSILATENAVVDASRRNRHVGRAGRLEKLRAAKAAFEADPEYFLKIPAKPLRPVSPVIEFLLTRPGVLLSVAVLREALVPYLVQLLGDFGLAFPVDRLAEIKIQLTDCTEPGVIKELQNEAATLSLPTAAITARNTRIALQGAWQPVEDANWRLLNCCLIELEAIREHSVEMEKILFSRNPVSLPHEATSASLCYDCTIKHIEQLLQPSGGSAMPELNGAAPRMSDHTALSSLLHIDVLADE